MALKYGITLPNSPGTIDADYRGEIKVILINLSSENFTIRSGDRIAQLIVGHYEKVEWEVVAKINDTERKSGGFGSN